MGGSGGGRTRFQARDNKANRDTTVGAKLLSLPIVWQRDVAKIDEASPYKIVRQSCIMSQI